MLSAATRFALAAQGVLAHRRLRRRDLELADGARARRRRAAVPRPAQPAGAQGAGPALRREPAPAGGVLPRRGAAGRQHRELPAAAGQGALVQQHRRHRRGLGVREDVRRAGVRHRQAHQPLRRRDRATPLDAYRRPFATDPASAFGGIIAFNRPIDAATVEAVAAQFLEVLIAPGFTADALAAIAGRATSACSRSRCPRRARRRPPATSSASAAASSCRRPTRGTSPPASCASSPERRRPPAQLADLLFAWRVAKFVKSNAIVYCGDGQTLGIGAGQMSRVDSTRIAAIKAENADPVAGGLGRRLRRVLPVPRRPRRRRRQRRGRRHPAGRQHARRRGDRRRRRARRSRWCSPASATSGTDRRPQP